MYHMNGLRGGGNLEEKVMCYALRLPRRSPYQTVTDISYKVVIRGWWY